MFAEELGSTWLSFFKVSSSRTGLMIEGESQGVSPRQVSTTSLRHIHSPTYGSTKIKERLRPSRNFLASNYVAERTRTIPDYVNDRRYGGFA